MSAYSSGQKIWSGLIIALIIIGLIDQLMKNPLLILLPLVIVGLIYYLYKSPPSWLIKLGTSDLTQARQRHKTKTHHRSTKSRKHSFRVIDGKKKKSL
jgi:hypothetical protein